MALAPAHARTLSSALAEVARLAPEHDRAADGAFPFAAWAALDQAGVPAATVGDDDPGRELALVRAVARADVPLGRILDGHLNAVQRLRVHLPDALAASELEGVAAGALRLGVWGADPAPGEGPPARVRDGVVEGVKTFCSGAGGLDRAWILLRGPADAGPATLAYVDLGAGGVEVDRAWFAGAGMRGSASHRVVFTAARALWVAPEPGVLLREPWFSGDALRTAATWAGGADAAADDALAILRRKGEPGDLEALAAGRIRTAQQTIDLWLAEAPRRIAAALAQPGAAAALAPFAAHLRDAVDGAIRTLLDEADRACGARPLATGATLERARRDLGTYVLQHRLDPIVARAGRAALAAEEPTDAPHRA